MHSCGCPTKTLIGLLNFAFAAALALLALTVLPTATAGEGAIITATLRSTVGVILAPDVSTSTFASLLTKPNSFWLARAAAQVEFLQYRMRKRSSFVASGKALPTLIPTANTLTIQSSISQRVLASGRSALVLDYNLSTTLLGSLDSVSLLETGLGSIGGSFTENLLLPLDPTAVFGSTGYACIHDDELASLLVTDRSVARHFLHDCQPSTTANPTVSCHTVHTAASSCIAALDASVGSVATSIAFTRQAWSDGIASTVRSPSPTVSTAVLTATLGASTEAVDTYERVDTTGCAVKRGCLTSGWRRLVRVPLTLRNDGNATLFLGTSQSTSDSLTSQCGTVPFYATVPVSINARFTASGQAAFEALQTSSQDCIVGSDRFANHEFGPFAHSFKCSPVFAATTLTGMYRYEVCVVQWIGDLRSFRHCIGHGYFIFGVVLPIVCSKPRNPCRMVPPTAKLAAVSGFGRHCYAVCYLFVHHPFSLCERIDRTAPMQRGRNVHDQPDHRCSFRHASVLRRSLERGVFLYPERVVTVSRL